MTTPESHKYGCKCEQCRAMIASIVATADDEYFFSDNELRELSMTTPESKAAKLPPQAEEQTYSGGEIVPPCTCNSPHIMTHAIWCEQYEFWNV